MCISTFFLALCLGCAFLSLLSLYKRFYLIWRWFQNKMRCIIFLFLFHCSLALSFSVRREFPDALLLSCVCDCVNYYLLLALRWASFTTFALALGLDFSSRAYRSLCVAQHARFLVASIASHSPNSFACMGSSVSALVLFYFFTSPVALVDYSWSISLIRNVWGV